MTKSIYLTYFFLAFNIETLYNFSVYAYADFASSELISTASVMASIIGGVLRLPTGKMLDVWGRAEGFLVMVGFITLGLIILASCNSVSAYVAGYVIYYIGYDGVYYVLTCLIADTTGLRNRALMFGINGTPYILTIFVSPFLASAIINNAGWRWGYGIFAIILPVVAVPISIVFFMNQRKAMQMGVYKKPRDNNRTFLQAVRFYFWELDVIGLFILMGGLVMFLLPFSLASTAPHGWRTDYIIALLVVGFCLIIFFPFFEKYLAPKQFLPWRLLKDRTILGACFTIGTLYVSFYCWDLYFYSFNLVVYDLTVTEATYMGDIYTVGSCIFGVVTGVAVRYSGRYKWVALVAVPINILGAALMIHFRSADTTIGYIVMCQIFIAFAGGVLVPCHEVAALAAGSHGTAAVLLAILSLSSSIGGAIGDSIGGALWQNYFPAALLKNLPEDLKSEYLTIYASTTVQLTYPVGSEGRNAINAAYGVAQKQMCIAATCFSIMTFAAVWCWRDINVKTKKQVRGLVV